MKTKKNLAGILTDVNKVGRDYGIKHATWGVDKDKYLFSYRSIYSLFKLTNFSVSIGSVFVVMKTMEDAFFDFSSNLDKVRDMTRKKKYVLNHFTFTESLVPYPILSFPLEYYENVGGMLNEITAKKYGFGDPKLFAYFSIYDRLHEILGDVMITKEGVVYMQVILDKWVFAIISALDVLRISKEDSKYKNITPYDALIARKMLNFPCDKATIRLKERVKETIKLTAKAPTSKLLKDRRSRKQRARKVLSTL